MTLSRLSPLHVVDGFAWGWVVGDPDQQAIAVQLWVDGRCLATEYAGVPLPERVVQVCGRLPTRAIGYAFALPIEVLDGFAHNLHVILRGTVGGDLRGSVLTFRSGPVCGEVEQQGSNFVGTVWFAERPTGRVLLRVADADDGLLHSQVLSVVSDREAHGFPARFMVPCGSLPDGALHFSCRDQALRGSPCRRAQNLVGVLNDIGDGSLRGWALDGADLLHPLELQVRVDGQTVESFRPNVRRPDISKYLNLPADGLGLVGFVLSAPEVLFDGLPHWVEVVSAATGQALKNGRQRVHLPQAGIDWVRAVPTQCQGVLGSAGGVAGNTEAPMVSVVILNRNGSAVLDAFLQSWQTHNRRVAAEIIVVDHASADDSLAMLDRWQGRLDLHVLALSRNDSFAASSNLGARRARGQYVLFMNNDIVWLQDALPRMMDSLQQPQVGVVGIKLLKTVGDTDASGVMASEVQHLGVRFKLNDQGYWPYETAPSSRYHEGEHTPQFVPAVTGAVMLCRKADFEAVGGFDTAYFYGFEDVELCLRLAYRLKKTVLCHNDCVALHRHGHTRLSGREMSVYDRVRRNAQVLESHIGVWIKQAYWRSLVVGDGYITREPLTIGLVVDAIPRERRNTALVTEMLELASRIGAMLPHANVVLLPPERDWKNVQHLHVLVVGDTRYDIRSLQRARPDLLTVAWLGSESDAWQDLPWWETFGAVLAPQTRSDTVGKALGILVHTSSPELPLGDVLGVSHWRLRVAIDDQAGEHDQANALKRRMRAEGLSCWILQTADEMQTRPMADVCITLAKDGAGRSSSRQVAGVLHLRWSGSPAVRSIAGWLQQEMETCVGSTFRSS